MIEAAQTVLCNTCGDAFELSARGVRRHARSGLPPTCESCRHPRRTPTQAERDFWTERFTPDEIRELAEAIWPPP